MKDRLISEIIKEMKIVYDVIDFKTKNYYHTELQKKLTSMAKTFNLEGVIEYRINCIKGDEGRKGKIDVVWLNRDGRPVVAIEVESALRQKSVMKLMSCNAIYKVYLYYGRSTTWDFKGIDKGLVENSGVLFVHEPMELGRNKKYGIDRQELLSRLRELPLWICLK
ncbi:hypothetical protein [Bacillus sp. OTU530]|uniref:hypothetical protein n=1 Tax=Bacillus sp. OTU530 TaxID=3043862 RepID=UPI00313E2B32